MKAARLWLALGAALLGALGWAGDRVAPDREAMILLKVMSYDRNLKGRGAGKPVVGVVYKAADAKARPLGDDVVAALRKLDKLTVQDERPGVVRVAYADLAELKAQLSAEKVSLVYFAGCLEGDLAAVRDATRAGKILTATACPTDVKAGLSLSISLVDGNPAVMLNLAASKAEGADFDSNFIRLAKLVE